jgi:hypothetical protein
MRQTRHPVVIKNTFNVCSAELSKKEDVWILNIRRHSPGQVAPAARVTSAWLRNCQFISWCSGHKSGLRQSSFGLKHRTTFIVLPVFPADNSSSIVHFTLTCLLFLEGYAVKTLNWIWGVEIKCPTCGMLSIAIYRAFDKLWLYNIFNRGPFLFVSREMCLMLRFWAI